MDIEIREEINGDGRVFQVYRLVDGVWEVAKGPFPSRGKAEEWVHSRNAHLTSSGIPELMRFKV
jgi:hypothetical protein